ncbi:hypothetical protein AA13594_2020 [Gluconacetobacter azotocaptans DSM 13594]|nr:hypothetical protein AA13594_2020 [Gluconacetobacter azotocaptans DSM 13594]
MPGDQPASPPHVEELDQSEDIKREMTWIMAVSNLPGQEMLQLGELALAFALSGLVGLEREIR